MGIFRFVWIIAWSIFLGSQLSAQVAEVAPNSAPKNAPADAVKSRRELLRDPSDLGIGLSLNRFRNYRPTPGTGGDRRSHATANDDLYGLDRYFYRPLGMFGYRLYDRSSLYDWQPPVVQQIGREWIIQPGYFRDPPPSQLWHP